MTDNFLVQILVDYFFQVQLDPVGETISLEVDTQRLNTPTERESFLNMHSQRSEPEMFTVCWFTATLFTFNIQFDTSHETFSD